MADLDDFFARKDRKKAKAKRSALAASDEPQKKDDRPKSSNPDKSEDTPPQEEDEWREFEEEKKDYTGLKIGNLTISETAAPISDDEREGGENASDGESAEGGGKHTGPWKRPEGVPKIEESTPQPPAQAAPEKPVVASYKPPGLRNQRIAPTLRGRNVAPDINNEEYFPSLNSKPPAQESGLRAWRKKEGNFEEVRNRGGGRMYNAQDSQAQEPKLALGNKFGALSQDQS